MITTRTPLCNGFESPLGLSRRKALQSFGMGLGSLALADLLAAEERAQSPQTAAPPAKAKRVIFLFQAGGHRERFHFLMCFHLLDPLGKKGVTKNAVKLG